MLWRCWVAGIVTLLRPFVPDGAVHDPPGPWKRQHRSRGVLYTPATHDGDANQASRHDRQRAFCVTSERGRRRCPTRNFDLASSRRAEGDRKSPVSLGSNYDVQQNPPSLQLVPRLTAPADPARSTKGADRELTYMVRRIIAMLLLSS
jgi:hypothetical protein